MSIRKLVMALEAVVFSQGLFGYACKESCTTPGGGACGYDLGDVSMEAKSSMLDGDMDRTRYPSCSDLVQDLEGWHANYSTAEGQEEAPAEGKATEVVSRRKRPRTKGIKNKEEVESQRMVHIAVERNRRKQMNEYLAVLRSLMPPSYVPRGDQASIVGGAINYVKELEQLLQSIQVQKQLEQRADTDGNQNGVANVDKDYSGNEVMVVKRSAMADIEVTIVESHVNLKVLSRRHPKQLSKLLTWLQNLRLTPLHLNVTTANERVLYSFSLKVEDDCSYASVTQIAAAVCEMIGRIREENIGLS
ncbi:transcription factor bHLH96-like isoform X2 [Musa acuminata AAA Group]|uniref:BHLH domain-containing protein n=1 Tax=Musa acuminata subsp. malaccensis TaxID=214687 RepID=A0A804K7P2_MUSAM|nr:PREDICTED: transcription factor bHLH96-like isoform X2 [Musa acuminata subsp. malaccensis]